MTTSCQRSQVKKILFVRHFSCTLGIQGPSRTHKNTINTNWWILSNWINTNKDRRKSKANIVSVGSTVCSTATLYFLRHSRSKNTCDPKRKKLQEEHIVSYFINPTTRDCWALTIAATQMTYTLFRPTMPPTFTLRTRGDISAVQQIIHTVTWGSRGAAVSLQEAPGTSGRGGMSQKCHKPKMLLY